VVVVALELAPRALRRHNRHREPPSRPLAPQHQLSGQPNELERALAPLLAPPTGLAPVRTLMHGRAIGHEQERTQMYARRIARGRGLMLMLALPIALVPEQTPQRAVQIERGLAPMPVLLTEPRPIALGPERIRQLAPRQTRAIVSRSDGPSLILRSEPLIRESAMT
jgi:hypothetical protein